VFKFFIIFIFCIKIFAYEATNGTTLLVTFDSSAKGSKLLIDNKEIPLLRYPTKKDRYFALVPIKYKSKIGDIKLLHVEENHIEKIPLHVSKKKYKKEILKVQSSKVSPPKKVLNRIYKEYKEATKIYHTSTKRRYWDKSFKMPLNSKITSYFGNARIFNGTLKSFHTGTDFRADIGTPIRASNDGVVVIARKRYYAGGSVVIDHGEGLYSAYYHLSKINVKVADKVSQNDIIGLSGKSGRVTGPHLHFSIMLLGEKVDPLDFIAKVNSLFN